MSVNQYLQIFVNRCLDQYDIKNCEISSRIRNSDNPFAVVKYLSNIITWEKL